MEFGVEVGGSFTLQTHPVEFPLVSLLGCL